jgi:CelD/BcsL family acetyltransferase involved in cellulose biosynthesis
LPPTTLTQTTTERERGAAGMICRPLAFELIPRAAWDELLERTPAATPFARWSVHRAWWDAYGPTAHDQYLVCAPADAPDEIRAIVPLMHRHMTEPEDEATATVLRRGRFRGEGTHVASSAKAIFFGASYHCDYATILADPADLAAVSEALVDALAGPPDTEHGGQPWDVVGLRRLRSIDPALPALDDAFRTAATTHGWKVGREREDVCPVVTFASGASWDDYLATLSKKARHEVRRKLRRAEAHGPLTLRRGPPTAEGVQRFIDLHIARFGDEGLFPDNEGGRRARRFVERLAELELAEGDAAQLELIEVMSGEQLVFIALAFDDGETTFLYNAGIDPAAAALSPGVTGTATYIRDRLENGRRRFDFLRGNEPYKYEWGAVDETVERLLVLADTCP